MVDLKTQYQHIKNDVDNAMQQVINSTQFINGDEVKNFQAELADYLGVKHVITCGNNTRPKIVKISAMKNNVTPLKTSVTGISFLTPATTKQFKPIGGVIRQTSAILTTIIPVYADIFASPTPWLGTAAIRLSTEMLLKHRHSQLLPGASKKHKTLRNYTDELRKHDKDLDSETLGSIETIISLGNQAAHGRGSSKEDYISALQKFVEVVEWHLSKPTI